MPIAHFHLVRGQHAPDDIGRLLTTASRVYSDVLGSPMDRVRAFAHLYEPEYVAVAGELVSATDARAPFFTAFLLAGRPREQRDRLLEGLTDVLVDVLDVPRFRHPRTDHPARSRRLGHRRRARRGGSCFGDRRTRRRRLTEPPPRACSSKRDGPADEGRSNHTSRRSVETPPFVRLDALATNAADIGVTP